MKRMLACALALSLIGGGAALARDHDHDRGRHDGHGEWRHGDRDDDRWEHHDRGRHNGHYKKWRKGERVVGYHYVVVEPVRYRLRPPPRGYHWVRSDDGDFLLAAVATGVILDIVLNGD